ncbi:phosphoglucosamine mutase, partial [candidate division KSB1 bacterium]
MKNLLISISGIRGIVGEGITPDIVCKFSSSFGTYINEGKIVVGMDSRPSGEMLLKAAIAGLNAVGCDTVDLGICPTPTISMIIPEINAQGGIAITASHNPIEYNALKFFDNKGFLLDEKSIKDITDNFINNKINYKPYDKIGKLRDKVNAIQHHIKSISSLEIIDIQKIRKRKFRVALDLINGTAAVLIPELLSKLGCKLFMINARPDGMFRRNPEPVPENLKELSQLVIEKKADIGFAFDPDGDRLAVVDNKGNPVGEDNTLALVVKYVLSRKKGDIVVNASTSMVIEDIAKEYSIKVFRTKVGEVYVAKKMQEIKSPVGGEGNGGIIFSDLHYGRDAFIGAVLILQMLAEKGKTINEIVNKLPTYFM